MKNYASANEHIIKLLENIVALLTLIVNQQDNTLKMLKYLEARLNKLEAKKK